MKKLLFLLLFLPSFAAAQETYSVSATANQVSILDIERILHNADVCSRVGLSASCTQAQFNTEIAKPRFAGITGTIYANSLAGRQSFLIQRWIADNFKAAKAAQVARNRPAYCTWWNDPSRTTAERNAECSKTGLSAGCDLCE